MLQLVSGLYSRLGQQVADDADLEEMLQPLDATAIEDELSEQIRDALAGARRRGAIGMLSAKRGER